MNEKNEEQAWTNALVTKFFTKEHIQTQSNQIKYNKQNKNKNKNK